MAGGKVVANLYPHSIVSYNLLILLLIFRKHTANDPKCAELGWRCVPLAVETYCNWGEEARGTFALLATRLAFGSSSFRKARVISDMFGRLNITLVRAIARAILARTVIPSDFS